LQAIIRVNAPSSLFASEWHYQQRKLWKEAWEEIASAFQAPVFTLAMRERELVDVGRPITEHRDVSQATRWR
jgi:hypothetical protein